jgi:hypothetical protein
MSEIGYQRAGTSDIAISPTTVNTTLVVTFDPAVGLL